MGSLTDGAIRRSIKDVELTGKQKSLADGEGRGVGRLVLVVRPMPKRVLAEWNASGGHRANMLIPQVRHYGIGQAIGPDGRTRFWAAVYAAPK